MTKENETPEEFETEEEIEDEDEDELSFEDDIETEYEKRGCTFHEYKNFVSGQ